MTTLGFIGNSNGFFNSIQAQTVVTTPTPTSIASTLAVTAMRVQQNTVVITQGRYLNVGQFDLAIPADSVTETEANLFTDRTFLATWPMEATGSLVDELRYGVVGIAPFPREILGQTETVYILIGGAGRFLGSPSNSVEKWKWIATNDGVAPYTLSAESRMYLYQNGEMVTNSYGGVLGVTSIPSIQLSWKTNDVFELYNLNSAESTITFLIGEFYQ